MASARHGLAVLRAYLNLRERVLSPATAVFDATLQAGSAASLADSFRRFDVLDYAQALSIATTKGIPKNQLDLGLALLEAVSAVDLERDASGAVVRINEQIGVAAPFLEQCDAVWDHCGPTNAEAAAVQSAEFGAIAPLTVSDHCGQLERAGFHASLHQNALIAATGAGLLYRTEAQALGEPILFSPYVWSTEALDVAAFFKQLPPNERQTLLGAAEETLLRPGVSLGDLSVNPNLLRGARRAGLIDATRVVTASNGEQSFVFSPTLERSLGTDASDVTHHRKLFTAHILYGHRFGKPGTGRIEHPLALVNTLIRNGTVRPSTAARTDFLLLESAGIVRVEPEGHLGRLRLVKDDIARDSLELLRVALGGGSETGPQGLWAPGSGMGFVTPERDRARLGTGPQPEAEAEALSSSVDRLRAELGRKITGEVF